MSPWLILIAVLIVGLFWYLLKPEDPYDDGAG